MQTASAASTIAGIVYGAKNTPLPDVDVELYGETNFRGNSKTDANGKYEFTGLGDGRYTIRVLPLRYDYEEQSDTIVISTVSALPGSGGADYQTKDFYLKSPRGSLAENEASVIFAQEVPVEAKKLYEKGIKSFAQKKGEEGFATLKEAVKIFPKYFQAQFALGREYFFRGKYGEAAQAMLIAADVNNKSAWSFYILGYSLLKLNYYPAAVIALNQAFTLSPASLAVSIALGTAQRLAGKYQEAEKTLKQAKKLSKTPNAEVHRQFALLYGENLKKYAEAADELEEYLKIKPDDPDAINLRKIINNLREKAKTTKPN